MKINKLSAIEAIALILIITINRLAINIPQAILLSCGSSSILNAVYISLITILLVYLIVKMFKNFPNSDIIDVSEFLGSKFLKYLIGIILFIYITVTSALFLRDFVETIHILYYTDTPIIYLLIFFIIVSIIANFFGDESIAKTNVILCAIMVVSLLIAFSSVIPNITFQRALPILGYGTYTTFFSGLTNIFAFNGLIVLFLVPPMLNDKKDLKKSSMIAVFIATILVILATASILLAFAFSTNISKISPLYMLLSNNEFGQYFQHPESLFVFTWILSFMSYLNISCMLSINILKKLTKVKNGKPFAILINIIILIVAIIPKNIMQVRELGTYISQYIGTPLAFIIFPIILAFANLKYKKHRANNHDVSKY